MPVVFLPDECQGCGGCCYLVVELEEGEQVPDDRTTIHEDGARVLQQRDDYACVYLDPESRLCTIYEQRPQVCRDFERGTGLCFTAIHRYGPVAV